MTTLYLIRHGENEYVRTGKAAGRLPGVHLNPRGQAQAAALAAALGSKKISAIYASPLERARETAQPLAEVLGLSVQIRLGLQETGLGDWQGQEIANLRQTPQWKQVQNQPSRFRFPGGESFVECQMRVVTELEAILGAHAAEEEIICVSHADPIKLAVAHYIGLPLDSFQRLGCDTASVTILRLSVEGAASLLGLNQVFS
jgi:probable phosphoglycerate mutase